jgi:hypothetical protein
MDDETLYAHLTLQGWEPIEYTIRGLTMWGLQTMVRLDYLGHRVVRLVYENTFSGKLVRMSPLRDVEGYPARPCKWEQVSKLSLRRLAHYVETGDDPIPDR